MATITYYTLESKKTYGYHYYYFAGYDDAGNMLITDEPGNAVAFRHNKEANKFLKNHQDLIRKLQRLRERLVQIVVEN